jgi:biotin-(acetyl-CoA carboxylase) ligase
MSEPAVLDAFRIRDALIARRVQWTQGAASASASASPSAAEPREGRGSGIDAEGRLLVSTAEGETVALDSGEVHLIA